MSGATGEVFDEVVIPKEEADWNFRRAQEHVLHLKDHDFEGAERSIRQLQRLRTAEDIGAQATKTELE